MKRLSRRTKVISIRLSREEYDQLQGLRISRGDLRISRRADSISELTRAAMKLLIVQENSSGNGTIESRVNEIHGRMSVHDRELARLYNHLGLARLKENL